MRKRRPLPPSRQLGVKARARARVKQLQHLQRRLHVPRLPHFYMEDEKSSVDQIQQEFETKVKHMYQDIIKMNKKIDIKIQKIHKYLVVKQQLVRKKKTKFSRIRKIRKNSR
jgi:ribonuclease I